MRLPTFRRPFAQILAVVLLASLPRLAAQLVSPEHHAEIEASYREMLKAVQTGDFVKARAIIQQAVTWEPSNPTHRYNFAAIEALIAEKEVDAAFTLLSQANQLGYNREDTLRNDPDLKLLRGDPRFARILAGARENAAAAAKQSAPAASPSAAVAVAQPAASAVAPAATARSATASGPAALPAPAAIKNGLPVGLYFMTRYWSYTHTLEKAAWYFAPDGTVYENLQRGFSAADLAAHSGRKGTAHIAGNKLTIAWAGGQPDSSEVERDGESFMWDMGTFTPVKPIESNASIAGNYDGGESVSHGGNRAAVAKRLELHPDGTYRWEGVSFVSGKTGGTELYAGNVAAPMTGRWQADAYSVTLTDTAGNVFRAIAFPFNTGNGPTPDHLFFAGIMYQKQ